MTSARRNACSARSACAIAAPAAPRGISRRAFVRSSALAAAGLALAGLSGCGRGQASSPMLNELDVAEDDIITLDGFKQVKKPEKLYKVKKVATLKAGSLLTSGGGRFAAVLATGETANPLSTVDVLDLETGKVRNVLARGIGHEEGFQIYDVACSDGLLVWVESNYLTGDWRVYSAQIGASGKTLESAMQLDAGDAELDVPEIASAGGQAYWIAQPAEDGSRASEDSLLKTASGGAVATAFTSHGRFNGGLCANGKFVCAMPRAEGSSGVYYQLTALTGGSVVTAQVMPRSFRPGSAIYMDGKFAFSIPASYDYGGGIANVGTYYPADEEQWLRLTKPPVTPPGLCGGWLFCKSGTRTVLVDITGKRYFTIDPPSGTQAQGDYPVNVGECDAIYTYASVTETTDEGEEEKSVVVRRITLA